MEQAHQIVAAGDELHLLHRKKIVVDGLVQLGVDRRELVLAGRDLVVLGLRGDTQRPQLIVQILHVGGNRGADGTEVVLLQLLALSRGGAKEGATGDDQVTATAVGVLLNKEVLLLVANAGDNLLGSLAKEGENALGLAVERRHGAQKGRLLVQRLAGVGTEGGGDTQHLVLDKGGAGGVPSGVAAGLEGGAQAAVGKARGVRFALDQSFAGKFGNRRTIVVGFQEAVVLLGRDAGERLEPMGIVRGPVE